ncbi:glycosyltransferase [Pseudomonadota bacterium]
MMNQKASEVDRSDMDRPLITLAIFACNQERFIPSAVEGAFSQTYSPLEIILSDDHSSDRTFALMKAMADAYRGPHKIVVNRNKKNLGIGEHVNKVFDIATGELIVMAAGDDVSLSSRCEVLEKVWSHENHPMMLLSHWHVIDSMGHVTSKAGKHMNEYGDPESVQGSQKLLRELLLNGKQLPLHGATAAYNKNVMRTLGTLNSNVIAEDYALFLRSLLIGTVLTVKQPLIQFRVHASNISKVDEVGSERFRLILTRNIPSYKNLLTDLVKAQQQNTILKRRAKPIRYALGRFIKSAQIIVTWPKSSFFAKYVFGSAYILTFGPSRHKKWLKNRFIKRVRFLLHK